MSAPSPCNVTQTPQREFAGAKVRKKNDINKKICTFDADLLILWSIADSKGMVDELIPLISSSLFYPPNQEVN